MLRLVVLAMGVVFFLSLLGCRPVLALVWGCVPCGRADGRPVTPWVMRMDPRTGWTPWCRSTGCALDAALRSAPCQPPRCPRGTITDVTARCRANPLKLLTFA